MFSRSASTERPLAIAGWFNSCARPAASVPSVVRRSRCVASVAMARPSSPGSVISTFGEEAMRELHRDGAFANGRGDALHGLVANVSGGEHARNARLEKVGVAGQRPSARTSALLLEIGSGEYEAILIALNDAGNPLRPRLGADEREEGRHLQLALLAVARERDGSEPFVAVRRGHSSASEDGDIWRRLDLMDEVIRHA